MNALERSLHTIVGHLRGLDRRFALVGGLAVSARAEPRLTRDADLAVVVSDEHDAEALVLDLPGTIVGARPMPMIFAPWLRLRRTMTGRRREQPSS